MSADVAAKLAPLLGARVAEVSALTGGDINRAFRVVLTDGRQCFAKTHAEPPSGFYAAEAAGLAWLRAAEVATPEVIAVSEELLVLAWLDGQRGPGFDVALGEMLARLHATRAPMFGGHANNFIGTLPQDNRDRMTWREFYCDARLVPLATLGLARGRVAREVLDDIEALRAVFDAWVPGEPASRLHGDLWAGNVFAHKGQPVLIDPAVYAGHREMDLAMLDLFGGLSKATLAAYQANLPLAAGWADRLMLWQVYPLLVHAVLFGGGYGDRAARALRRFSRR